MVKLDVFCFGEEPCCESFPGSWGLELGQERREVTRCCEGWGLVAIAALCEMTAVTDLNHLAQLVCLSK